LDLEKDIHLETIRICKLSMDKVDLALTSFLQDRVILRQVKVIHKRANQYRDLKRSNDDVIPLMTDRLNIPNEVEKLENRLRLEITRREWKNQETPLETRMAMVGSITRF